MKIITRMVARFLFNTRFLAAQMLASALCAAPASHAQDTVRPLPSEVLASRYAGWTALSPGFDLRVLKADHPSRAGDGLIVVARIDPGYYELAMAVSAAKDRRRRTARDWAWRESFVATINGGMFRADPASLPAGFTRADGVTLNPALTADLAALSFGNPTVRGIPRDAPRILDRDCDDFDVARLSTHANVLQGIRMISCDGRNVWSMQPKEWSMAAIAMDAASRILLIHTRSPYPVHTFADMLKASPLDVQRAMYLEGGPEATLFVHVGSVVVERIGSYETGFHESDDNVDAWPLPNVIGVRTRPVVDRRSAVDRRY